jgi:peptide deformylase
MADELKFELTLYPDPVLRKVAEPVEAFDGALKETVEAMFERMYASNGVGLAAPQVGLRKRILVLNPTGEPEDGLALVNVTIKDRFGPETTFDEGCLSFPEIYAEVVRPESCKVSAFSPDGTPVEGEFDGFTSRILQHEYDHLEGILLVDRMSPAEKHRNRAALAELVENYRSRHPAPTAKRGKAVKPGARRR